MIDSAGRPAMGAALARTTHGGPPTHGGPRFLGHFQLKLRRFVTSGSISRVTLGTVLALGLAGSACAETLADAVAMAYAHNPDLNRQRYLQQARDEGYVQARSQYGPTLSVQATGGFTRQYYPPGVLLNGTTVDNDSNQATLTLSQPLYTAGRFRGALESARSTVKAGQEQVRSTEQQTVQNAIIAYAAVIRDQARLEVGRENVQVLRGQLDENRARRRVGDVTLTDVGQADARLAAAESQLAALEANLAVTRGEYLQIIGQNPGTLAPLPELAPLPQSLNDAFERAEANNPDIASTRYTEQASSANAAAIRGQQGPSVSASVQGLYTNRLLHIDGRDARKQFNAGVTITQPLFASGAIRSRVRQADAQDLAAQVAVDGERRVIMLAVTQSWSQLAATRIALVTGVRQVESAQLAFAGMVREQRFGLRSTIEVLNAEQELQQAQLSLLQSRYSEYVARAALLAAIGALNAKSIAPDIDVYDPEKHFEQVRYRGMTPLEPLAMGLDRIGSAAVRRPLSAELTGADSPLPDQAPAAQPQPTPALMAGPLVPITQSALVPESSATGARVDGTAPAARGTGAAPAPGTPAQQ